MLLRYLVLKLVLHIDEMLFCRGTVDDYDRWARVTGDDGWSWKSLLPFIFSVDHMTAPVDHHNTTGEFNPAIHKNGSFPSPYDVNVLSDELSQAPSQSAWIAWCWISTTVS